MPRPRCTDRVAPVRVGLERPVHRTPVHRPVDTAGQPVAVARLGWGPSPGSHGCEPAGGVGSGGKNGTRGSRRAGGRGARPGCPHTPDRPCGPGDPGSLRLGEGRGFAGRVEGRFRNHRFQCGRSRPSQPRDRHGHRRLAGRLAGRHDHARLSSLGRRSVQDPRHGRRRTALPGAARHTQQRANAWPGPADLCQPAGIRALGELRPDPDRG